MNQCTQDADAACIAAAAARQPAGPVYAPPDTSAFARDVRPGYSGLPYD